MGREINKKITIIEIGITSRDNLQSCENFKKQIYIPLANELSMRYKMQSEVVPFVITWDDMVTKFNTEYRKKLGIEDKTLSYIQSISMKKTFELIVNNPIRYDDNYPKLKNIDMILETLEIDQSKENDKLMEVEGFGEYRRDGGEIIIN